MSIVTKLNQVKKKLKSSLVYNAQCPEIMSHSLDEHFVTEHKPDLCSFNEVRWLQKKKVS